MNNTPRTGIEGLETAEALQFQQASWRIEQIAFVLMLVLLALALLGILGGHGPLSHVSAGAGGDALQIGYQRFTHVLEPTTLNVTVNPAPLTDRIQLTFSAAFLDGIDIEGIQPEPERSYTRGDEISYVFRLAAPAETARIAFTLQPNIFGLIEGKISLEGGPSVSIQQAVYP